MSAEWVTPELLDQLDSVGSRIVGSIVLRRVELASHLSKFHFHRIPQRRDVGAFPLLEEFVDSIDSIRIRNYAGPNAGIFFCK